jgi:hypothetical protein
MTPACALVVVPLCVSTRAVSMKSPLTGIATK